MFQQHRETQSIFSFAQGSSAAQMQNSSRLIFHVTRVVKYITKVTCYVSSREILGSELFFFIYHRIPRVFQIISIISRACQF